MRRVKRSATNVLGSVSGILSPLVCNVRNALTCHRRPQPSQPTTKIHRAILRLERAVRVELTITGFAVQCLRPLGNAREDLGHGWTRIHTNQKGSITESYFLTSFSRS